MFDVAEPPPPQSRATDNSVKHPSIAIVVTSTCDATLLRPCLTSLAARSAAIGAKLIVVHAGRPPNFATLLGAERMSLTIVTAPAGTSEADLRRIGAKRSGCNIIAFADDRAAEQIVWAQHLCHGWEEWKARGQRISGPLFSPVASAATAGSPGRRTLAWLRPYLSVVVPVHNGGDTLARALEAISKSDLPREFWELVVVDDGSTDDTPLIAAEYADRLVRLPDGPHGPGYSRNRGFELTLGECVAFVNADVLVRPKTLRRFYEVLTREPKAGAVFGSYDSRPMAANFVSQYRNLLQHYSHQRNGGEAATFWSGCGAVRSAAFEDAGRFDEWHFRRHQLEDIEFGQRIRQLGHRVLLRPEIQVTNLKRWTLGGLFATEIFDRGVPWMRLVNRAVTPMTWSLGTLRSTKKTKIALTWIGAVLLVLGLGPTDPVLLAGALGSFAIVAFGDAKQLAFFRRERGVLFAMKTIAIDFIYHFVSGVAVLFGWIAQHAVGEPRPGPVAQAFSELEVKTWPPVPLKRLSTPPGGMLAIQPVADAPPAPSQGPADLRMPANIEMPADLDTPTDLDVPLLDVPLRIDVPPNAELH